jgi:hypothetical protein
LAISKKTATQTIPRRMARFSPLAPCKRLRIGAGRNFIAQASRRREFAKAWPSVILKNVAGTSP